MTEALCDNCMRIRGAKVAKKLCVYLYGQSIYGITTHIIKKLESVS